MIFVFIDVGGRLELESGDRLLLENDNGLALESGTTPEGAVTVYDLNPTLAVPYYEQQPFQSLLMVDPATFQPVYHEVWQNQPATLMPTINSREHSADVAQMSSFHLQLFANVHFGPDGTDAFAGPLTFEILEGPSEFEVRTPE